MFDDDTSREAADRLGQVWDDVTRGGGDRNRTPDGDDAAFAGYLQRLTPRPNDTTRERMRARVLASQRGEADFMDATSFDSRGLIAPLPQQPRIAPKRPRLGTLDSPLMRIAAMILLALAIAGTWFGLRSFDGGEETPTPVQGALIATPEPGTEEVGFRETVLLHEIAAVGQSREFTASISRVTMPAGSDWYFDSVVLSLDAFPIGFYVESGTLTVNQGETSTEVKTEEGFNNGRPSSLHNPGSEPVTFIMLVLHADGDILPTLPGNMTSELLGDVPISQPLGSVTNVNFSRGFSNMPDSDPIGMGGSETVAFVAVNYGSMTVEAPVGSEIARGTVGGDIQSFAPASGYPITLDAGDTVTANTGSAIGGQANHQGTEMVSSYVLTIRQESPEEVAQQQLADGADITWTIPAGSNGNAGMMMRTITLQPGAEWSYQFDGVVQYQNIAGNVSVGLGSGELTQLTTGQYISQSGSGELVIRNTGTTLATLLQASMMLGNLTPEDVGPVPPDGVTARLVAAGQVPVAAGAVEIHLATGSVSTGSTLSTESELGATLFAVTSGSVAFTPVSGDIDIVPRIDSDTGVADAVASPVAGAPAVLNVGDAAIVRKDASYSMTGSGNQEGQLLWFWFQPADTDATPAIGS